MVRKYVINNDGLPIIFDMNHQYYDILTTIVSGGYVTIHYDSRTSFYFVACFKDELFDFQIRLEDNVIIEKHLNGCLFEDKIR